MSNTPTNTIPHHVPLRPLNTGMPPGIPITTTVSAPPPNDRSYPTLISSQLQRIRYHAPLKRRLSVIHPPSLSTNQTYRESSIDRITCHRRNLSISLTLPPPTEGACGGWLTKRVLEECAEALFILRAVLFALLLILIVCLFSRYLSYVMS